jgi:manganese oxidase
MLGAPGPYETISMGGMFTVLKVRGQLQNYDQDPGWYTPPPGTQADAAPKETLERNGIAEDGSSAPRAGTSNK